ncbi:hypothetical protein RAS1_38250 [Phycisphaerae bacterium RAS1]|nr:hypothetical protein RAS1_38250 [Phycisphaerae bacterium RAS1]
MRSYQGSNAAYLIDRRLADGYELGVDDGTFRLAPHAPAAGRRIIRAAAAFDVTSPAGVYPEMNISMGRIVFEPNDAQPRRYRPFSRDAQRRLTVAYLGPEGATDEDCPFFFKAFDHFRAAVRLPADADGTSRRHERFEHLHRHAHGWFHLVEMQLLDLAVRSEAPRGGHIIEIGSYQGRSTAVLAAAAQDCGSDALVISIDPNELSPQQADVAAACVASVGQRRRLVQIQRPAARTAGLLRDELACVAFIDGSHEYADVVADFELCDRWLRPGGLLALHDIFPAEHLGYPAPDPGPGDALRRVILPTRRYEPIAAAHLTLVLRKQANVAM